MRKDISHPYLYLCIWILEKKCNVYEYRKYFLNYLNLSGTSSEFLGHPVHFFEFSWTFRCLSSLFCPYRQQLFPKVIIWIILVICLGIAPIACTNYWLNLNKYISSKKVLVNAISRSNGYNFFFSPIHHLAKDTNHFSTAVLLCLYDHFP